MGFSSENAKKAGKKGSRKGVPNKPTPHKQILAEILASNIFSVEALLGDIKELKPNERVNTFFELSKRFTPTLKSVEFMEPKEESNNDHEGWSVEDLQTVINIMEKYENMSDEERFPKYEHKPFDYKEWVKNNPSK